MQPGSLGLFIGWEPEALYASADRFVNTEEVWVMLDTDLMHQHDIVLDVLSSMKHAVIVSSLAAYYTPKYGWEQLLESDSVSVWLCSHVWPSACRKQVSFVVNQFSLFVEPYKPSECSICCLPDQTLVALTPCGHVICEFCTCELQNCPYCRMPFTGNMRLFFA